MRSVVSERPRTSATTSPVSSVTVTSYRPDRPLRARRTAVAVRVCPVVVDFRNVMSAPWATVMRSSSLHAIANAVSASAKTSPPWVMWNPFVMSSRTRIDTTA